MLDLARWSVLGDTGGVIELTEPQMWTVIGIFGASTIGMITLISTWFMRVMRAEFRGLRGEFRGEIRALGSEITRIDTRLDGIARRLDGLDRDVAALMRRALGEGKQ